MVQGGNDIPKTGGGTASFSLTDKVTALHVAACAELKQAAAVCAADQPGKGIAKRVRSGRAGAGGELFLHAVKQLRRHKSLMASIRRKPQRARIFRFAAAAAAAVCTAIAPPVPHDCACVNGIPQQSQHAAAREGGAPAGLCAAGVEETRDGRAAFSRRAAIKCRPHKPGFLLVDAQGWKPARARFLVAEWRAGEVSALRCRPFLPAPQPFF